MKDAIVGTACHALPLVLILLSNVMTFADGQIANDKSRDVLKQVVARLVAIQDIADVSMAEREQILKNVTASLPLPPVAHDASQEEYMENILVCVKWLTSSDFSNRDAQDAVCQRLVLHCLSLAGQRDLDREARLVNHIRLGASKNIDANGRRVVGEEWQALRNQILQYRLRLWQRIENVIDPNWDPNDLPAMNISPPGQHGYSSGVAPESIKEPDIRRQYEAALEANRQKGERYRTQRSARKLRDRYSRSLKKAIADAFKMQPVSQQDLDKLKEQLSAYVSDEKLRGELLEVAQTAAKGNRGEPAAPTGAEND